MGLTDRLPERLQHGWLHVVVVALVVVFVLDDIVLGLLVVGAVGGLLAVAAVLIIMVAVLWGTDWGQRRLDTITEFI